MTTQARLDIARHALVMQYMNAPGAGRVFYVSTAARGALDTNDGTTPESAFLTIDYAIGQCAPGEDDYIFVIDHDDATETYPIVMDVDNVHLIGKPIGGGPMPQIRVQGDVDGIDVEATRCEIAGFWINTAAQADTKNLVHMASTSRFLHFHDNFVAWRWWGSDYCMLFAAGGYAGSDSLICNNYFGAHGWNAAGNAIWISGQCGRLIIRENMFVQLGYQTGGPCIYLASENHCCILNNQFVVTDAVDQAIDGSASNATNIIHGNCAMEGEVQMAAVPFDVEGDNHWGLNYSSILAVLPA